MRSLLEKLFFGAGSQALALLALAGGLIAAWQVDRYHVRTKERTNVVSEIDASARVKVDLGRAAADAVPAPGAARDRLLIERYCRDC
jgi:hypothetical protein